ncbi:hypothetical protein [Accumulibacter sp.]|uniref:hypothetical protein n=1 Tax=Accumulibacter sp. TaxID=2053492 RepID=UPI002632877F|nr:hypothetical protein [Accumulibacter sp.]
MRRTEAIDEAGQATDLALAGGDPASADGGSTLDQRRRRLVRGAAAFAPLVLTLRSGALAAASCTGTKIRAATTDDRGRIETVGGDRIRSGLIGSNDNPSTPDYCFKNIDSCPDTSMVDKISTQDMNDQSIHVYRTGSGGGTNYYCGTPSGDPLRGPADFRNQNIAILSSASATSLINAG